MRTLPFLLLVVILAGNCRQEPLDAEPTVAAFERMWTNDYGRQVVLSNIAGQTRLDRTWLQLDTALLVVHSETGELLETIPTGASSALTGARRMLLQDDRLFIHTPRWVRCYHFGTGQQLWDRLTPPEQGMVLSNMASAGNYLAVPKKGGAYLFDLETGGLAKELDLASLFALDAVPENLLVRELGWVSDSSLAMAVESYDEQLPGGAVFVLDTDEMAPRWSYTSELDTNQNAADYHPPVTRMATYGDRLFFLRGSYLHCVAAATGETVWVRHFPDLGFRFGLAVAADGTVYVGSTGFERIVIALDAEDGTELWRNNLGYASISYLGLREDYLFVLAEHLVVLDRHTGEVRFDFVGDTGDFFYTPPIIGEDRFIGISSQRVYAWGLP